MTTRWSLGLSLVFLAACGGTPTAQPAASPGETAPVPISHAEAAPSAAPATEQSVTPPASTPDLAGSAQPIDIQDARKALPGTIVQGMPQGMSVRAGTPTVHSVTDLHEQASGTQAAFAVCISHDGKPQTASSYVENALTGAGWTARIGTVDGVADKGPYHLAVTLEAGTMPPHTMGTAPVDHQACKMSNQTKLTGVVTRKAP